MLPRFAKEEFYRTSISMRIRPNKWDYLAMRPVPASLGARRRRVLLR